MTTRRCLVVALVWAALTACSSSASDNESPGDRFTEAETAAPTGLTGFGASRKEWDAHHEANPDPNLDQGCCFGPPVKAPDNGGTADTWNLAASGDPIDDLIHNFAPGTAQSDALQTIASRDLPPDARQVATGAHRICTTWIFRSKKLATVQGFGSSISVTLYSGIDLDTGDSNPYDPADIRQAIESLGRNPKVGC